MQLSFKCHFSLEVPIGLAIGPELEDDWESEFEGGAKHGDNSFGGDGHCPDRRR
jgi:hypothetical protein